MGQKPKKPTPAFAPLQREPRFQRETLKMDENHGWRAAPGHQIVVLGRGDLRLEYPEGWVVVPTANSLKLHDRPYPDDDMVLEVSCLRNPPLDWRRLPPLENILCDGLREQGHLITPAEAHKVELPGLQLVWAEYDDIDERTGRAVTWRQAHCCPHPPPPGLRYSLFGILTFGSWKDIRETAQPVWEHIVQSIVMGQQIADPKKGPVLQ